MRNRTISLTISSLVLWACGTSPASDDDAEPMDVAPDAPSVDVSPDASPPDDVVEEVMPPPDTGSPDVVDDVMPPRDITEDAPECPGGPEYQYESEDPGYCEDVGLHCEFPGDVFSNECGCGCYFPRSECAYAELGVLYQQVGDSPEECATIFFGCEDGGEAVEDDCGCGCVYEPPTCLDPARPDVTYVGRSPAECQLVDFDCGGLDYFDNPCGCGCLGSECPGGPAVSYVANSAEECAVIDFGCFDGWTGFDAGDCGCGCQIADCPTERFLPPSGLADDVAVDAACDFLVACTSAPVPNLRRVFTAFFPDAECRGGTTAGCPADTSGYCEVPLGTISDVDLPDVCTIASAADGGGVLCGGDF